MQALLKFEKKCGFPRSILIGVDEVGRGCLAGAVFAAAVVLPYEIDARKTVWLRQITDSKVLTAKVREDLEPKIKEWALAYGVASASPLEIDEINIFHASHLAMKRAIDLCFESDQIKDKSFHILVDGKFLPKDLENATAVIKGDSKSLCIAAASILAKVARDRQMVDLEQIYPGYGFAKHKGYPTKEHLQALEKNGITEIHRKSFGPVSQIVNSAVLESTDSLFNA